MNFDFADWQSYVIPVLTALGGGFGTWLISFYKEKKTQDLAANDQAIKIYQELFITVRDRLVRIETAFDSLEKEYMVVQQKNMMLQAKLENLSCQKTPSECPIVKISMPILTP